MNERILNSIHPTLAFYMQKQCFRTWKKIPQATSIEFQVCFCLLCPLKKSKWNSKLIINFFVLGCTCPSSRLERYWLIGLKTLEQQGEKQEVKSSFMKILTPYPSTLEYCNKDLNDFGFTLPKHLFPSQSHLEFLKYW